MSLGNSEFTQERRDLPQAEGVEPQYMRGVGRWKEKWKCGCREPRFLNRGVGGMIPQKQPEKQAVLNLPVRGTG